jgi:hypothetical protein
VVVIQLAEFHQNFEQLQLIVHFECLLVTEEAVVAAAEVVTERFAAEVHVAKIMD